MEQGKGNVFAFLPYFYLSFKVYFIEMKWILRLDGSIQKVHVVQYKEVT